MGDIKEQSKKIKAKVSETLKKLKHFRKQRLIWYGQKQ